MPPDQGLWPREKLAYEVSKFRKLRYFFETFSNQLVSGSAARQP